MLKKIRKSYKMLKNAQNLPTTVNNSQQRSLQSKPFFLKTLQKSKIVKKKLSNMVKNGHKRPTTVKNCQKLSKTVKNGQQ